MSETRPINSNSCYHSLLLPSMALVTALFISRVLQFSRKGTTLFCLSAFTVTWIAASACADSPPPIEEEEETDPVDSPELSRNEEEEDVTESENWLPWAEGLLLKLTEMQLISSLPDGLETENIKQKINNYANYPLSTFGVREALSTLILQLHFKTQEVPQAAYLTCLDCIYPGFTLPPIVFTEEELLNMGESIIQECLEEGYVCLQAYNPPQKIWIENDNTPPANTPFTISTTPPKDFFKKKLLSAEVQITEDLENFLGTDPDLNIQKNRAKLSELIWGNTTQKHTLEYNFCFDFFRYPVWENTCPPLLELEELFVMTKWSLRYLKDNPPYVKLHIKDNASFNPVNKTLFMPPHVAADFLTKLFPNSLKDYSLIEGGEISFSKSRNAVQWQYADYLTYGKWNITEEKVLGYWPLKILE